MNRIANAIALLGSLAMVATAAALDLDDLRKALEKPRGQEQGAAPSDAPAGSADKKRNKPDLGSLLSVVREISPEEEAEIGRQIAGNLLGAAPLVPDASLQGYVNRVGRWVASQSRRPDLKWTFGVIDSADVNAFAAPGGYVFLTKGLYARLKDEAQLAGVLAHEIGHVQQKHHLKVLQKQQLMSLGSEALSKQIKGEKTIQRLIGSGAEIMARGLDKNAEFEADRIGVVLAGRAGYDPFGLPAVLQDLTTIAKDSGAVALLFKTHPAPEERLTALSEAIGDRFDSLTGGKTVAARLERLR
ncbi:MAG TPA: M48 family metalloprotease [Burkholderiales bacterium]|nr:M48 family metalloprotease [Burkholderiales bacterium]